MKPVEYKDNEKVLVKTSCKLNHPKKGPEEVDCLPALNIPGIVLIISSPEGQRFGDLIAKTYVTKSIKP